jgi:hypothetical protein
MVGSDDCQEGLHQCFWLSPPASPALLRGSPAPPDQTPQDTDLLTTERTELTSGQVSPAQSPDLLGGLQGVGQRPLCLLRASFCRSRVPNCPLGSDPSCRCTPSGAPRQRVKWPAAAGRWEPIVAIFNLIKAVSTIDFGSFNYWPVMASGSTDL